MVVFGTDEFFWTAYFCEDAYFRDNNPTSQHLQDMADGPSSGTRPTRFPIWDPRYYFLDVLVIRMGQITMEWSMMSEILASSLDQQV